MNDKLLTSGKFLSRQRAATLPVSYSIGYSYSSVRAGVFMRLTNEEQNTLELRMTPEQAEDLATKLMVWAAKTREYQKTV